MDDVELETDFFSWLYSKVANERERSPRRTYWKLLRTLHRREFTWLVPNDDNRALDGIELRRLFVEERLDTCGSSPWFEVACSFLEMLIALSLRMEFETGTRSDLWFWHLLSNIGISQYTDHDWSLETEHRVDDILDTVVWRTYRVDGRGGLFPLEFPAQNQTKVELWYQMSAYLIEHSAH